MFAPRFEARVVEALAAFAGRDLARDIRALSDFYIAHPGAPTPWHEEFTDPAYLAYFLPLNFVRLRSVWREVERAGIEPSEIWDFGSGIGTTQWVLEEAALPPRPLYCLERAPEAVARHRALGRGRWTPDFSPPPAPRAGAMAIFSYSFLEMRRTLPDLSKFEHLVILEPSTREAGRELMRARGDFLAEGFNVLAPCTHAADCPLLVNSPRDWCHVRIPLEAPDWWRALEEDLPMKNRTLTYSYLVLSRSVNSRVNPGTLRVIGDTLTERGKTRQLICRGPRREFLSWLHRFGEPPRLSWGSRFEDVSDQIEVKGDELRVKPGANLTPADNR